MLSFSLVWSADSDIRIISRSEWGADESLRYADSPVWETPYTAHLQYLARPKSQSELDAIDLENTRISFLQNISPKEMEVVKRKRTEN
jgi:hypothetical protein